MKRIVIFGVAGIIFAGIVWAAINAQHDRPIVVGPSAAPPAANSQIQPELMTASPAPDFTLPSGTGSGRITFSKLRGDRPAVLVFSSFTCDLFVPRTAELDRLYRDYKDRARFLFVNVTEAGHEIDGLKFMFDNGLPDEHTPLEERRAKLARAAAFCRFTLPSVIDDSGGVVEGQYHGHPLRLYSVRADGRIAEDYGRVTFGDPWDLNKLESWLKELPKE